MYHAQNASSRPAAASLSKQGIGSVGDSIVSCLEGSQRLTYYLGDKQLRDPDDQKREGGDTSRPSPIGRMSKKSFWKWSDIRRAGANEQDHALFYHGNFLAHIQDLDLLEILILVAKTPQEVDREWIDTFVNNLSSLVRPYIKGTETTSSSSFPVLDERLLQEIKTCLHRRSEAKQALSDKDMSENQRLRCLLAMIDDATQSFSLPGLRFLVSQCWELFEHLPWEAQERVVEGFFCGEQGGFLVKCVNQAMIESENPLSIQPLFSLQEGDKKSEDRSQEAIAARIGQLTRENPRALARIQRTYYYATALFRRVYRDMRERVEANPALLQAALQQAMGTAQSPFFR